MFLSPEYLHLVVVGGRGGGLACLNDLTGYAGGNYRSSKKMDGIWNRYNLKSTGRIYTFGVLKCLEKFKVLDLP